MKHVHLLILLLLTCFWAGCSDDLTDSPNGLPKKGIVVQLTTGRLDTKAHLYSQASLQHVSRVYAILYYCGETAESEINPETTTVVASQLLKKDNKIWNPSSSTNNALAAETFALILPKEQISLVPGKYMIVCVGLDDASGETYGLTYDETQQPPFTAVGAKLSEAQAVFAKTAETKPTHYAYDATNTDPDKKQNKDKDLIAYGQPDIAHSELFAGWETFDFMPDDLNVVQVELRRRVAGLLCYFSDIPYKLNIGAAPYRVTKVRVQLHAPQNGQISLLRQPYEGGKPSQTDFGQPVEGKTISQTLCEFDLINFTKKETTNGDPLYQIPTSHLEGRKQLENTILMGTYLLPIKKSDQATLRVELLGYEYDDTPDSKNNIVAGINPDQDEPTLIKSFPAIYEGSEQPESYDLFPNMMYHIGHKLDNDNTEGDYPESLAGTKVTVKAKEWMRDTINVEFPAVPIVPGMSWTDKEGNKFNTQPENEGDDYYIFDSMGSSDYSINISASILYSRWKLEVVEAGGSTAEDAFWIELWDEDAAQYVTELTGTGEKAIKLQMHDYASVSASERGEETRTIILRLTAIDNAGNLVADTQTDLLVTQYNALIVKMEDDENGYRGFSHFDFGTQRNPVTGEEIENSAVTLGWGYWKSFPITPAWENGKKNYEFLLKHWSSAFENSAVQRCGVGVYGTALDLNNYQEEDVVWFLAARDELLPFFTQYHNQEKAHIKKDQFYWTSNEWGDEWRAAAGIFDTKKNEATWHTKKKKNFFYARQACFTQQ